MKTLYFETNQYVRREGNVIDFTEYRERLQRSAAPAAVGDNVSYHWEVDESIWHYEEPKPRPRPVKRRSKLRFQLNLPNLLELCTAAATLGLVITVWLQFLL